MPRMLKQIILLILNLVNVIDPPSGADCIIYQIMVNIFFLKDKNGDAKFGVVNTNNSR